MDAGDGEVTWRELEWTGAGTVDGGVVLFASNHVKLRWNRVGGFTANVVCSSTDSVVFEGNSVNVVCESAYPGEEVSPMTAFYSTMAANSQGYSFVVTNAYVGGFSTVQVGGNRFSEPRFDALFSCVAGPALMPGGDFVQVANGVIVASNSGSHGIFQAETAAVGRNVPSIAVGEDTLNTISFTHESYLYKDYAVQCLGDAVRTIVVTYPVP